MQQSHLWDTWRTLYTSFGFLRRKVGECSQGTRKKCVGIINANVRYSTESRGFERSIQVWAFLPTDFDCFIDGIHRISCWKKNEEKELFRMHGTRDDIKNLFNRRCYYMKYCKHTKVMTPPPAPPTEKTTPTPAESVVICIWWCWEVWRAFEN